MRAGMSRPHCCLTLMTNPLLHYHWLASNDGTAELSAAASLRSDGVSDLKIGEFLRERLDSERSALILTQLDLRERATGKFSRANEMLFTRAGLEQSTSEPIARYRAERYSGYEHIVDLCCGLGGDLISLSGLGTDVTAVDRDPVHLFLAEHNAHIYHPAASIRPLLESVESIVLGSTDAVFIDPARREGSGRRTGYQSEPSVEWAVGLADRAAAVGIKTAPGIPRDLVPTGWELEMIALGSDLKEAVMWSPALARATRAATVVDTNGAVETLTPHAGDTVPVRKAVPGDWLHDVNPAVTNAGLVEDLARHLEADRIDSEIGFLVSSRRIDHPMVTSWQIIEVLPWHEKRIKQAIAALDIGPIDIRRRGLAGDVPSITKRLRGKGTHRAMIAMTRMENVPTAIICSIS